MVTVIKTQANNVKNNILGAVAGAGLTYYVVKKHTKVEKTWKVVLLTLAGAVAGAFTQSKIKSFNSTPTTTIVKGK